jgi:hypothetical protein
MKCVVFPKFKFSHAAYLSSWEDPHGSGTQPHPYHVPLSPGEEYDVAPNQVYDYTSAK